MRSAGNEASRLDDRVSRKPSAPAPSARSATDPTFYSRFECKYVVSRDGLDAIRRFIEPFTRADAYAARAPQRRYAVSSLYLDSADLRTYSQTVAGEKERFKLRVRTYSDDSDARAFFEVKRKIDNVVHKRRAGLSREQATAVLQQRSLDFLDDLEPDRRADLDYFRHLAGLIGARPVLRVRYRREAYEGRDREPVRVTIDTDLMHVATFGAELSHHDGRWSATPVGGAILEIKFTERFPGWVQELVRSFGLKQRAVPKYVMSVDHLMLGGRSSSVVLGGSVLPPAGA